MTEAQTAPAAAPPAQTPPPWYPPPTPPKKSRAKKILIYVCVLILALSLILNAYLGIGLAAMLRGSTMSATLLRDGDEEQVVATYAIHGMIDSLTAAEFARFYRLVRDTPAIKAVVVRVESGGGTVAGSDEIHAMIKKIRQKLNKPVVISMGSVAASGGYYLSAPANAIYAEPTTLTASIGVVMPLPVVHDFLKEHGVNMVMIRSAQSQRYKAAINYFEKPDPEILRARQALLDEIHETFVDVVKAGRGDKVKTRPLTVTVTDFDGKDVTREQTYPFNGQVMMADEARTIGLIDSIGYADDAIDAAARLARLDKPRVIQYARSTGLLNRLLYGPKPDMPVGFDTRMLEQYLSATPMMIWNGQ